MTATPAKITIHLTDVERRVRTLDDLPAAASVHLKEGEELHISTIIDEDDDGPLMDASFRIEKIRAVFGGRGEPPVTLLVEARMVSPDTSSDHHTHAAIVNAITQAGWVSPS